MTQEKDQLPKIRIGEILLQKGLINPTQLRQALVFQQDSQLKLGEILVQQGLISPEQLQQVLVEQRWRNLVTSVLLSVSTLAPNAPQLASNSEVLTPEVHGHHAHAVTLVSDNLAQDSTTSQNSVGVPTSFPGVPEIHGHHSLVSDNLAQGSTTSQNSGGVPPSLEASKSQTLFASSAPLSRKPTTKSPLTGFCHPTNGEGWLSQGIRGTTHQGRMEYAYDLAVSIGTPIYAMRSGAVIGIRDKYPDVGGGKENASRFNYTWIEHEDGYRSIYVHLQQGFRSKVNLKAGDQVEAGQLIGYSGNSGWSSGPHLHVEVQKPSAKKNFSKTVPFAISGSCNGGQIAQKSGATKK